MYIPLSWNSLLAGLLVLALVLLIVYWEWRVRWDRYTRSPRK